MVMLNFFEARTKSWEKCGNSIFPEGENGIVLPLLKSNHDWEIGESILLVWKTF
jgi:hypothetical protein